MRDSLSLPSSSQQTCLDWALHILQFDSLLCVLGGRRELFVICYPSLNAGPLHIVPRHLAVSHLLGYIPPP